MTKQEIINETVEKINDKQGENTVVVASEIISKKDKRPKETKSLGKNNERCLNNVNSRESISKQKQKSRGENVFEDLFSINVNDYVEKKKDLSYLSWTYAWAELKKRYPKATYKIKQFGENQLPYVYDENTGYMVFTEVTINDITHSMWLPVMDSNNKSMKSKPYTYDTKYKQNILVNQASMFDINKTIMRCLVKNLAMFGLGLYIYAGEDLPMETAEEIPKSKLDLIHRISKEINLYGSRADSLKAKILNKYSIESLYALSEEQAKETLTTLNEYKENLKKEK